MVVGTGIFKECRRELLASAEGRMGASHYGAERREEQEAKAGCLAREEMREWIDTAKEEGRENPGPIAIDVLERNAQAAQAVL